MEIKKLVCGKITRNNSDFSCHLLSVYHMPRALYLSFIVTLLGKYYFCVLHLKNFKAFFKGCCNHIGWWFSNHSIFWYHLIWQGECSKILSLTFNQSSSSSSALYNNCLCKSSSFKRVFFLKKKSLRTTKLGSSI